MSFRQHVPYGEELLGRRVNLNLLSLVPLGNNMFRLYLFYCGLDFVTLQGPEHLAGWRASVREALELLAEPGNVLEHLIF